VDIYLDNLVAQINTPVLERLSLTLLFDLAFTLVELTEFIHRTKWFECLVAKITFNKNGASIEVDCPKLGIGPTIGKLSLHINCEPLDWQIDSATQVCSALGKVLCAVEELTLGMQTMHSDRKNTLDDMLWWQLLLPFIGVKKLHIYPSLAFELSQALQSVAGGLALELLPELQALEVKLGVMPTGKVSPEPMLSAFVKTRDSVGRPIHLNIVRPRTFRKLPARRR
jgi:hypothetical protein